MPSSIKQSTAFNHMLAAFCDGTLSPRVRFAVNSIYDEPSTDMWYSVADDLAELEKFAREAGSQAKALDIPV